MALDDSALPELLAVLRTGDRVDLIRDAVRLVMQELIEIEATGLIGAKPYERTGTQVNERNGHRPRVLATTRVEDPEVVARQFLPGVARAASSDRSGVVWGGHAGLRRWGLGPLGR